MSKVHVTWKKSAIGYNKSQKSTIRSLGLRKLGQSIELDETPSIRGMIAKVSHLIEVREAGEK